MKQTHSMPLRLCVPGDILIPLSFAQCNVAFRVVHLLSPQPSHCSLEKVWWQHQLIQHLAKSNLSEVIGLTVSVHESFHHVVADTHCPTQQSPTEFSVKGQEEDLCAKSQQEICPMQHQCLGEDDLTCNRPNSMVYMTGHGVVFSLFVQKT